MSCLGQGVGDPLSLPLCSFENEAKRGITLTPTYRWASKVTVSETNAPVGGHTARCVGLGVSWTMQQEMQGTNGGRGGHLPTFLPLLTDLAGPLKSQGSRG